MSKFTKMSILAFALLLILSACGQNNKEEVNKEGIQTLNIGVIPTQAEGEMNTAIEKLRTYLEKELNMPVKIEVYPDYNGVVEAMNYGSVNMAYFGPFTYVLANNDSGAQAIITQLVKGEPFYYSYIITQKDSPLNTIDDLIANSKNITFAFGDPQSTSGSLIPSIALQDLGVYTSQTDHKFKNVVFTGGHDATAIAIESKQFDAGAIDSAIFDALKEKGVVNGDNFKVIWQSEKLFQYPWAVSKNVDPELSQKIQNAFLKITDPEILIAFGATGFTKATDADYEAIRQAAIKAGRLK